MQKGKVGSYLAIASIVNRDIFDMSSNIAPDIKFSSGVNGGTLKRKFKRKKVGNHFSMVEVKHEN